MGQTGAAPRLVQWGWRVLKLQNWEKSRLRYREVRAAARIVQVKGVALACHSAMPGVRRGCRDVTTGSKASSLSMRVLYFSLGPSCGRLGLHPHRGSRKTHVPRLP